MSPKTRGRIVILLKLVVATGLVGWLVRSGTLDFGAVKNLAKSPKLLAWDLASFFVASLVLSTLRWRVLLDAAAVRPPLGRMLTLQSVALFFNVALPGNVGGDVAKAIWIARDQPAEKRTTIFLVAFVERVVGLAGLVGMACVVVSLRAGDLLADPKFRPIVTTIYGFGAATFFGPVIFLALVWWKGEALARFTSGPSRFAKLLAQLVASARLFSERPKHLALALLLSMGIHAISLNLFTIYARELVGLDVSYSATATVFPLGMLSLILPISLAGVGVGHVAFDRLFAMVGLTGGATVFNVFLIGQIVPSLSGVIPYLAMRGKTPAISTPEAES